MDRNEMRKGLLKLISATISMSRGKLEASGCYSKEGIQHSTGKLAEFFAALENAKDIAAKL